MITGKISALCQYVLREAGDRQSCRNRTCENYTPSSRSDRRSIFRYDMHTLPNELAGSIGTSTLFAAWNAAIYVCQIEDERLTQAVRDGAYLDATSSVLKHHGG